jgi:superfamily II DNA or RNA helicase
MNLSFTLRPYQQSFADSVVHHLAKYKRVIACAATGSGKTKTFVYLAARAKSKGLTVLILTESAKIFRQLTKEVNAGRISDGVKDASILPGHIYIAMAQTLAKRKKMIESFAAMGGQLLVINDEAHIGTSTKLLKQFPDALHIGFTATPDWRFAKHLPELYNACVVGPQPDELIQGGHLVSYQHFARVGADLDQLKIEKGEFTKESQEAIFDKATVYAGLTKDLTEVPFKKAMVFTASIKSCQEVSGMLWAAGIPNIQSHSKCDERTKELDLIKFEQSTDMNVCVSVGEMTKGYDYPPLDLVVLYRATTSLPLYMQMIGRGSRPSPGKNVFTVLDYGGNFKRHGLWDAEVDWGEKWKVQKKKKEGVAPVKFCPACDYINPAAAPTCKNCGHVFEKKDDGPSEEETRLVEITASYRKLIGRTVSSLTPMELSLYAKFKNKKAFAIRVARAKEQTTPDYLKAFAFYMGYKEGWAYYQLQSITTDPIQYTDITLR